MFVRVYLCSFHFDLILETDGERMPVGKEVTFQLNYSAMVRSMTSPFVVKVMKS